MASHCSRQVYQIEENDHEVLVNQVKCQQRSSEIAREGWRHYCGALADGVRDPQKHNSEFLRNFLKLLETGQVPQEEESYEPRLIRSACPSLGGNQLELWMPESEVSVMKDVVNANCYALAPGKSSLLQVQDVLLDVGAHVGTAAALALRTPEVTVVCVEPHPVTFEILQRNLLAHPRATLLNLAIDSQPGTTELYAHRGTNNPSRLFFASLFATRSHADVAISVNSVTLQDLISRYQPSVLKMDCEGAERYLKDVEDFGPLRRLVVEWDWTHNRERSSWEEVQRHLASHDFKLQLRGMQPSFDASGRAVLHGARRKRGNTGMVFVAARKPLRRGRSGYDKLGATESLGAAVPAESVTATTFLGGAGCQPSLRMQLEALSMEQLESRLRYFGEAVREVEAKEFFVLGFQEKRREELLKSLCDVYERPAFQRTMEAAPESPELPEEGVRKLLEVLRKVKFEENLRPSVQASGYLILKATSAAQLANSHGADRLLGDVWRCAEQLLRKASSRAEAFHFTAMAVTKNFRGSPHIDQNDFSVQYALSVGDFGSGGELCVEESPLMVKRLNTHNRLVCIDGRFPHWVSGYSGERYSIIFYRSSGEWDAPKQAIHPV